MLFTFDARRHWQIPVVFVSLCFYFSLIYVIHKESLSWFFLKYCE